VKYLVKYVFQELLTQKFRSNLLKVLNETQDDSYCAHWYRNVSIFQFTNKNIGHQMINEFFSVMQYTYQLGIL